MCLIIHKPAEHRLSPRFVEHVWRSHHHGWGMVRWAAGRAVVHRGMALDELQALLARMPVGRPALLHLRQATHGPVSLAMTHPFQVRPGVHLMHNGRLEHCAAEGDAVSDTHEFAGQLASVLAPLPKGALPRVLRSPGFARLLAPAVTGSMVLLCDDAGFVTLGRAWQTLDATHWDDDAVHGLQVSNLHTWLDTDRTALRLVA